MDVRMPDGVMVRGIPEGTPKEEIMRRYNSKPGVGAPSAPESSLMAAAAPVVAASLGARVPETIAPNFETAATRGLQRLPGAIVNEAREGREQFMRAFEPREVQPTGSGIGDNTLRGALALQDLLIGGARSIFPIPGGLGKSLAQEPVERITGSKLAGQVAGVATPVGAWGITKVPALARRISEARPVTQLGVAELGGDAAVVPNVSTIGARPKGAPDAVSPSVGESAAPAGKSVPGDKTITFSDLMNDNYVAPSGTRQKLADIAQEKFNFTLTRGERSGSRFSQGVETGNEMIFGGSLQGVRDQNKVRLNNILTSRVGSQVDEITPGWISEAFQNTGQKFDALSLESAGINTNELIRQGKNIAPGPIQKASRAEFMDVLSTVEKEYGPVISPASYAEIRSQLLALSRGATDRDLARKYSSLIDLLDDGAESAMRPEAASAYRQARQQYKDLLIIDQAYDRGTGMIDPGRFASAVEKSYKRGRNRVPLGGNDMIDLAQIVRTFKNQIPSSGTSERAAGADLVRKVGGLTIGVSDIATLGTMSAAARAYRKFALSGGKKPRGDAPKQTVESGAYGSRKGERIYSSKDLDRNPRIAERLRTSGYTQIKIKDGKTKRVINLD